MDLIFKKSPAYIELREARINEAITAYMAEHPKCRKAKRPDLRHSGTGFNKIYLRNSEGLLVAIYGECTRHFWKLREVNIKKHSIKKKYEKVIKINQPKPKSQGVNN